MSFLEDEPREDGMFHTKMRFVGEGPKSNMNTEQVVEMIDTITEGKPCNQTWESADLSDDLNMAAVKARVRFTIRGEVFEIDNPRTAREIAGALIAWANRKEGSSAIINDQLSVLRKLVKDDGEIQREFEELHRTLKSTPDIPQNKNKLASLQQRIQFLRENGAKDFESDV